MPGDRPTHAYLGLRKCGCFGFIGVDQPGTADGNAGDAAWIIKGGGTVERLPLEEAKSRVQLVASSCSACAPGGAHDG